MKKLIIITLLNLTQLFAITYDYDDLNRLEKATYENGVVFTYTYDDADNLLTVKTTGIAEPTDTDNDGISDARELELGLEINNADTDNDGLSDLDEVGDVNNPRDTDGDGTIDALDTDSDNDGVSDKDEVTYDLDPLDSSDANADNDNDGVSNADEIAVGTDPKQSDETITIKTMEDIYVTINAQIDPIVIEATASNGSTVVLTVESNDTDIAIATLDSNMITLDLINNAHGSVEITVTASLGSNTKKESFDLIIRSTFISEEDQESGRYIIQENVTSHTVNINETSMKTIIDDNGLLEHSVEIDLHKSIVKVTLPGTEAKIDHNYKTEIILPVDHNFSIIMDINGEIELRKLNSALLQGKLPLGTQIEADAKKVRSTIPMPARLRF